MRASLDLLLRTTNKNTADMARQHSRDSGEEPEARSGLGRDHTLLASPGRSRNSAWPAWKVCPTQSHVAEARRPAVPIRVAEQTSMATHHRDHRSQINSGEA